MQRLRNLVNNRMGETVSDAPSTDVESWTAKRNTMKICRKRAAVNNE
jgi:hypothetical protein